METETKTETASVDSSRRRAKGMSVFLIECFHIEAGEWEEGRRKKRSRRACAPVKSRARFNVEA